MTAKPPPVPPANRTSKGGGADPDVVEQDKKKAPALENLAEQDQQGNIHQNTTNQGYQQDR